MTPPNIAFVGKAGAGKSTAARVLVERFAPLNYDRISFATALKVGLNTQTDRRRLQEFGTDIVRRYEPDFWVRLALHELDLRTRIREQEQHLAWYSAALRGAMSKPDQDRPIRWVNDDCRFENELFELEDRGWAIVEVTAPRQVRIDRLKRIGKLTDEAQLNHESENSLGRLVPHAMLHNGADSIDDDVAKRIGAILERL